MNLIQLALMFALFVSGLMLPWLALLIARLELTSGLFIRCVLVRY